jgi:hypothetical protein
LDADLAEGKITNNPDSQPSAGISCPQCFGKAVRGPLLTWRAFQASLVVYFMSLFTVNKLIESAAAKANEPRPEDFVFNPFIQKTPRVYVPPDYSLLYVIGILGLCIVVFLFFSALAAKNTCETCGHRWKP